MRRWMSIICAAALLLVAIGLTSCDLLPDKRSEEAKAADDLIAAIGTVTLESEEAIKAAEMAVNALSAEEKATLRKQDALTSARKTFNTLRSEAQAAKELADAQQAAREIDSLILAIGNTVTKDSGTAIKKARAAYNAASSKAKELVTKMQNLIAAENAYDDVLASIIVERINALGGVTLKSEAAISEIKAMYDSLSSVAKNKVNNYSVLTDAEKKLAELKVAEREKKFKSLVSGMKVEKDEVTGNTFYYPSVWPRWADDRCFVLPYIGRRGDQVWLCAKYHYTDDDWVFFKKIIFSLDDGNITRSFNYFDLVHDNGGGDVWEYYHEVANGTVISIFRKIAVSNKRIVRFKGDDHSYDFTISAADQAAIKKCLEIYDMYN